MPFVPLPPSPQCLLLPISCPPFAPALLLPSFAATFALSLQGTWSTGQARLHLQPLGPVGLGLKLQQQPCCSLRPFPMLSLHCMPLPCLVFLHTPLHLHLTNPFPCAPSPAPFPCSPRTPCIPSLMLPRPSLPRTMCLFPMLSSALRIQTVSQCFPLHRVLFPHVEYRGEHW